MSTLPRSERWAFRNKLKIPYASDNEIKSVIFRQEVITVEAGKLSMLGALAHVLFCEDVGVRFPHATRRRDLDWRLG